MSLKARYDINRFDRTLFLIINMPSYHSGRISKNTRFCFDVFLLASLRFQTDRILPLNLAEIAVCDTDNRHFHNIVFIDLLHDEAQIFYVPNGHIADSQDQITRSKADGSCRAAVFDGGNN
jgi:hypothetical protein